TPKLSTSVWVGYPNATTSMNDVNGLGPGFGGTLAAPIWHDYMVNATNGYCGDFPPPTHPWHGTAFVGQFASTGTSNGGFPNSSGGSQNGGGGTSAYNNPTLFAHPPQPPSHALTPPGARG